MINSFIAITLGAIILFLLFVFSKLLETKNGTLTITSLVVAPLILAVCWSLGQLAIYLYTIFQ